MMQPVITTNDQERLMVTLVLKPGQILYPEVNQHEASAPNARITGHLMAKVLCW